MEDNHGQCGSHAPVADFLPSAPVCGSLRWSEDDVAMTRKALEEGALPYLKLGLVQGTAYSSYITHLSNKEATKTLRLVHEDIRSTISCPPWKVEAVQQLALWVFSLPWCRSRAPVVMASIAVYLQAWCLVTTRPFLVYSAQEFVGAVLRLASTKTCGFRVVVLRVLLGRIATAMKKCRSCTADMTHLCECAVEVVEVCRKTKDAVDTDVVDVLCDIAYHVNKVTKVLQTGGHEDTSGAKDFIVSAHRYVSSVDKLDSYFIYV
jgi:hypothetical protein